MIRYAMANCAICGSPVRGPSAYDCNYCTGYYCRDHRLPENHECPGLGSARAPGSHAQLMNESQSRRRSASPMGTHPDPLGWEAWLVLLAILLGLVIVALYAFGAI